MNIWSKVMTALRGGIAEASEAIVDSQALRILDQQIRDAGDELKCSKNSLAETFARQKVAEEKCANLGKQIKLHEGYAIKALNKGDNTLAREVAEKIADIEAQLVHEREIASGLAASVNPLRFAIKRAEQNLKRIRQQVDTVKATDSVQRAKAAVAERYSGSNLKMRTATESLQKIKEKQALKSAQIAAAEEIAKENSESSLRIKLQQAGIVPGESSADDILNRLKKNKDK